MNSAPRSCQDNFMETDRFWGIKTGVPARFPHVPALTGSNEAEEQPAVLTCKQGITRSSGKSTLIFPRVVVVAGGVIAALLAAWVWSIGVAQAQENSVQGCGEPIVLPVQPEPTGRYRFQQIAEPYDVRVDLYPSRLRIGTTVVGIYVWEASTCQPVTDAAITLWTRHGEADEQKKVTANNIREESEPERYHAQMTLDAPGDWQVDH